MTIGSVAPISVVGTMSTAKAAAKRAGVRNSSDDGSDGCSTTQRFLTPSRISGVASALRPTPISTSPNVFSGDVSLPAIRPAA